MKRRFSDFVWLFVCFGLATTFLIASLASAYAGELASPWSEAYKSRVRMIAGTMTNATGGLESYVGVHVKMQPKWKTYWRSPGEAGGVPPSFDWSKSSNIKDVQVQYPAPVRLQSEYGANIGYQGNVVFPVRYAVVDPSKPADLNVNFSYGICKDICVPAESTLRLIVPASVGVPASDDLANALRRVPHSAKKLMPTDPRILKTEFDLASKTPHVAFEVKFPTTNETGDVFVEGPGGIYIPMAKHVKDLGKGVHRFDVDLSRDVDLSDIRGKDLFVTVVGEKGQSEFSVSVK